MNLTRCSSGHFYDSDKYGTCPHCSASAGVTNSDVTMPVMPDDSRTMPLDGLNNDLDDLNATTQSLAAATANVSSAQDDSKTISFASQSMGTEPTVGWLVVIDGPDKGADFRLKSGRNFIGRSSSMDVALKNDKTVSREKHSIVVFDPKSCSYLVQPGTAKELCYLDDEVVLEPRRLQRNNKLTVGETTLLFVPLCSREEGGFSWDMVK